MPWKSLHKKVNKPLSQITLCITGSFGFKDIGDEAMLTEDLDFILTNLDIPRDRIYLIGGDPTYISYYHKHPLECCFSSSSFQNYEQLRLSGVKHKATWLLKSMVSGKSLFPAMLKNIVRNCDALLVTGGGTINTRDFQGNSLKRMYALVRYFSTSGVPVFMSGQTIGPLGLYEEHDRLAAKLMDMIDVLTVRDSYYSRRYLEVINAHPETFIETFDDAYTLPYRDVILPQQVRDFLELGKAVALNVTEYTSKTDKERKFIAHLCEYLIHEFGFNVVLVSHAVEDYFNLFTIYDMLDKSSKASCFLPDTRRWHDKMLKKLISCCRLALGGRYHFVVFAATSNTPFIGMCGNHYSYIKQDGFARPLGLERFILTEKETWDMGIIKAKVRECLECPLEIEDKFSRPSVSMQHFKQWLQTRVIT